MVEQEGSEIREVTTTFNFKDFKPEKLNNLKNWELVTLEEGRRWLFVHKEFDTKDNDYLFEVYKTQTPIKDTMETNRVSLMIKNKSAFYSLSLIDVRSFTVGRRGIGLPGEGEMVSFNTVNESFLEIRDSGFFSSQTPKTITEFSPLS